MPRAVKNKAGKTIKLRGGIINEKRSPTNRTPFVAPTSPLLSRFWWFGMRAQLRLMVLPSLISSVPIRCRCQNKSETTGGMLFDFKMPGYVDSLKNGPKWKKESIERF